MTIHMREWLTDWVKLYPLGQPASGSEEGERFVDLPNLWPVRVAFATWMAVSQPGLLLAAVRHCAVMQHDSMMCTVQLVRHADKWADWMHALDEVEDESVIGVLACGSIHLDSRCSDCCGTVLARGAQSFGGRGIRLTHLTSKRFTLLCRLPPIAKPYLKDEAWSWDLLQCFMRLADRLRKVLKLSVYCSARMALCLMAALLCPLQLWLAALVPEGLKACLIAGLWTPAKMHWRGDRPPQGGAACAVQHG